MNLFQITPVNCLFPGLHVDSFGDLWMIMSLNVGVIGTSGVVYGVYKLIILKNQNLDDEEKSNRISQTKEFVYNNLFFFMYVTYLSTCSKTAGVLPFACRKLCKDEKEELCNEHLKADYSVQCQGTKYNHLLIVAYISTAYILALPAASFIALWRKRRLELVSTNRDTTCSTEIITGLCFLFENYKTRSWYWEMVEMSRKIILTSVLFLVRQESQLIIGANTSVIGLLAGKIYH